MAKPIFKSFIRVKMLTFEVGGYAATAEANSGISFNAMCPTCRTKVASKYYCEPCQREVTRSEALKGYEFAKKQWVTFTQDEVKACEVEGDRICDVGTFIDADDLMPEQIDKTYFLVPTEPMKIHGEPFALIREAMKGKDKTLAGIGKIAIWGRDRLVAIVPAGRIMVMHILRPIAEIQKAEDLEMAAVPEKVDAAAMQLANAVVKGMTEDDFDFGDFKDRKTDALVEMVKARMNNQPLPTPAPAAEQPKHVDVMAALAESLKQVTAKKAAPKKETKAATKVVARKKNGRKKAA